MEGIILRIESLHVLYQSMEDGCNLVSLPTSIHKLTHLTTELSLANTFTIPSDLDWSQFPKEVTIPLYLNYMMRTNKIESIFHSLIEYMKRYMKRFDGQDYSFQGYRISEISGFIARSREGGLGLIAYIASMLTNGGRKRESGYGNRIREWTNE